MTEIWELPTGNYTIFALVSSVVCMVSLITAYLAHATDVEEICRVKEVLYIQEDIQPSEPVYVVILTIVDCFVTSGSTDIILRLRGSTKNGPLLLFRDYEANVTNCTTFNIGFSVPFNLGSLVALEIAADNSHSEEGSTIFSFSDLIIRKIPRKAAALANSNTKAMLQVGGSPFEALASHVRTWISLGTLVSSKGINIIGTPKNRQGRVRAVCTRAVPLELPLVEELSSMKAAAKIGFRPLHYMWSQFRSWHDEWSDYSQLDQQMTICLDLLATLVSVSSCFAFGVEKFVGSEWIANIVAPLNISPDAVAMTVEEFDFVGCVKDINRYIVPLTLVTYMAIVASVFVIPLSLIWSRLFRMIGGKGYEGALVHAQSTSLVCDSGRNKRHRIPRFSARHGRFHDTLRDETTDGSSILLRTLEVKNTYTASSSSTTRQLTMEPLVSNCPPDHITARSIAYIRTKMTRLRNESIPSGQAGLKQREVLHESHTQSTDAPVVPPPSALDGTAEVFRVSRFCERLVQQGSNKIHDNSVIAECFEVVPEGQTGSSNHLSSSFTDGTHQDADTCCHQACCQGKMKPEESISDMTFFTEEDAISLQEMVDHMTFGAKDLVPPVITVESTKENRGQREQRDRERWPTPQPSGKQSMKNDNKTFKNSLSSPRQASQKWEKNSKRIVRGGVKVLPDLVMKEFDEKKKRFTKGRKMKRRVTFDDQKRDSEIKYKSQKTSTGQGKIRKTPHRKIKPISSRRSKEAKKSSGKYVPSPSLRSRAFYDSESATDVSSEKSRSLSESPSNTGLARKAPFKGLKVKLSVFLCLVLLQLTEIFFITAYPIPGNRFFIRNSDGSPGGGASRMSCALLSSLIALIWYPLFTVHLVALLSYLIESIRMKIFAGHADELSDVEARQAPSSVSYQSLP